MASSLKPVLDAFARFRATWPKRGWSFDNRFLTVASTIDTEFASEARLLIAPMLPHAYNEGTLATATPLVRQIATRTGGVRASQMIFAANPVGPFVPYGLWWPWGEAPMISIRLGIEGATANELFDLCAVFGAE